MVGALKSSRRYFPSFKKTSCLRREITTRRLQGTTKPLHCAKYIWQTSSQSLRYRSMDAQRCANTLEPLKQVFSFRKVLKTTTLTKSKWCDHGLSWLAMFYCKVFASSESDVCFIFPWAFLLS